MRKSAREYSAVAWWPLVTFIILSFVACAIIFSVDTIPLNDYPNHIARLTVLKLDGIDPIISDFIAINWHYVTNLGLEVVAIPLLYFFDPDTVGRIFLCISLNITASGTIFLHRALGGSGPWPYIVFLFLFNNIFIYGFLSFIFSIGLVLWSFAYWLKKRDRKTSVNFVFFSIVSVILMTCHLFAYGLFALLIISYEIAEIIEHYLEKKAIYWRKFISALLQLLPSLIIFYAFSETSSNFSFILSSILTKLSAIASIITLYDNTVQIVCLLFLTIILAILWRRKLLVIAPRMFFFIIMGAAVFLIAPQAAFGSYFLDYRLPVAFLYPFIASLQFKRFKMEALYSWLLIIVICLAQYININYHWSKYDAIYEDMFNVTSELKAGDTLFHIAMSRKKSSENLEPPIEHAPTYLLVKKRVIVPFLFADSRHQPISYVKFQFLPKNLRPLINSQHEKKKALLEAELDGYIAESFDYLLLINFENEDITIPKVWQLRKERGLFKLYKNKIDVEQ